LINGLKTGFKTMENQQTLTSIKDYAETHGISVQAVYQQLKRQTNRQELKDHIIKKYNKLYLDEYAVSFLESKRETSPTVIIQSEDKAEIDRLRAENELLKGKIAELQERHIQALEGQNKQILELTEKVLLLTEREAEKEKEPEETPAPLPWWKRIFK
jgi:hypothetical protein